MATSGPRIILASNSPRRRDILERLGLPFEVVPAGLPEETDSAEAVDRPAQVAEALALAKADAVADDHPEALVLGADTLVCVGGRCLGKPADAAEARAMLEALSGRTHTVVTGVALIGRERGLQATAHETTAVTFRRLSEREIAGYAASGEPADKAGAYAVQGKAGLFVERVEGDYDNVVGLPLKTVARMLEAAGVELWPGAGEGA
ncbi:Maf family protein [Nitrospinae bacterium AH_259_B05_G02_I21]|nr:Maf family protein [Nitrospinae bacterium AH_259_B05_G02_I21]